MVPIFITTGKSEILSLLEKNYNKQGQSDINDIIDELDLSPSTDI
jgi:hypothetical protein